MTSNAFITSKISIKLSKNLVQKSSNNDVNGEQEFWNYAAENPQKTAETFQDNATNKQIYQRPTTQSRITTIGKQRTAYRNVMITVQYCMKFTESKVNLSP
jgi:hypothetical protein